MIIDHLHRGDDEGGPGFAVILLEYRGLGIDRQGDLRRAGLEGGAPKAHAAEGGRRASGRCTSCRAASSITATPWPRQRARASYAFGLSAPAARSIRLRCIRVVRRISVRCISVRRPCKGRAQQQGTLRARGHERP